MLQNLSKLFSLKFKFYFFSLLLKYTFSLVCICYSNDVKEKNPFKISPPRELTLWGIYFQTYLFICLFTHTHTHKKLWEILVKIGEGYMGIFVLFLATFCNFKLCHIKTFKRWDEKPQISIFSHFFKNWKNCQHSNCISPW